MWNLGDKRSLKTDLRFSRSTNDGKSNVDNKAFSGMLTYAFGYSKLGASLPENDRRYESLILLVPIRSWSTTRKFVDFAPKDEKSWQLRYDYNFAGMGISGLSLFTRYVSGSGVDRGDNKSSGNEWERRL